jgi:hypothetical protein
VRARTSRVLVLALTTVPAASVAAQSPAAAPTVRFAGYLQARETYQRDIGLAGSINRARLTAYGALPHGIGWRIQGEFRTGSVGTGKASVSLQDAYFRWASGALAVQLGQFKTPFTREFVTSLPDLETADRSTVVDSLAPKRDIGLMAEYTAGGRGTVSIGVFNGEGQNVTANRDSSLLGVARVTVRLIPLLALGANVASYFGDSTRYGADASLEAPWLVVRAEYVAQHRQGAALPDDKGWYALAAVPLLPMLQPVAKYEWFNRPAVSAQARNRAWTAGVNLFPFGRDTRLTLAYVSRRVGDPGVRHGQALAQAQVRF